MSVKCLMCDRKYVSRAAMEVHADECHPDWRIPKSKGWATPYGFIDLREPVTYAEACAIAKEHYTEFGTMLERLNHVN